MGWPITQEKAEPCPSLPGSLRRATRRQGHPVIFWPCGPLRSKTSQGPSLDNSHARRNVAANEEQQEPGQAVLNRTVLEPEPSMSGPSERAQRVLRARTAAHAFHARVADEAAHTAPARAAFLSRFEREVDPDGALEPQERARRAEHAKKAYFLKLAAASSRARSKKTRK